MSKRRVSCVSYQSKLCLCFAKHLGILKRLGVSIIQQCYEPLKGAKWDESINAVWVSLILSKTDLLYDG